MTKQATVSRVMGLCLAAWALGAPVVAHAEDAAEEFASSVEKDFTSLDGDWLGQSSDGTKVSMHFGAGRGNLPLSGKWRIEGGAFAGDVEVNVLHAGGLFFLLPEASPFAPATEAKELKAPYSMTRLPSGGLRFVRLTRTEVDGQVALQSEQLVIGKAHADGTRTLRLAISDKLCADVGNPATLDAKVCGEAVSTLIVLRKTGPAA